MYNYFQIYILITMILEFGTNTEYVTLPFEMVWGSEVQVEPYSSLFKKQRC